MKRTIIKKLKIIKESEKYNPKECKREFEIPKGFSEFAFSSDDIYQITQDKSGLLTIYYYTNGGAAYVTLCPKKKD